MHLEFLSERVPRHVLDPRFFEDAGILDRDAHRHVAEIGAGVTFLESQHLRLRKGAQPPPGVETDCIDDKCVFFPPTDS